MKFSPFLILVLIGFSHYANAQTWVASSSSVSFSIKMLGSNVKGNFKGLKPNVQFQNDEPLNLSATVLTNTLDTDNSLRDKHLKEKEDFFQVDKFPFLSMSSTQITKINATQYQGTFKITIKAITKVVKIPINFTKKEDKGMLMSEFTINRNDWNFGGSTMGMSDNVKVKIILNLDKK